VLCLYLSMFGFSGSVCAHAGHSHGTVAAAKTPHAGDVARPDLVVAAHHVALPDREAAHEDALMHQDLAAASLGPSFGQSPAGGDRMSCSCGMGCGSCSSASCCSGTVIPPALDWIVSTAATVAALAPGEKATGLCGAPLPRPPNPVRLS
jgi:hypothetical protein